MQQNKTWKDIWTQKSANNQEELTWLKQKLQSNSTTEIGDYLLKLNGFDSKTGALNSGSIRAFMEKNLAPKLAGCESFYDVGCGSGAFLYLLLQVLQDKNIATSYRVGGCDYSEPRVRIANFVFENMPINPCGGGGR
ncbi:class I SAM-dependent methyltransferase [Helicobacter sp. 11S02596-1]|uniref:class I SAM-dependent methyltransferase n=1 Tax=Helicobacter sp. 11S02596-1 TaxID=1476194 RepID=UPI000BA7144E|nr:class I SAM-dependent methyltransferase [Helicobacter sp. 11S02596-1]PAF41426.1 hypothetical protein BJI48_08690 [Helicobacter sp. 11S02596-1]